MDHILCIAPKLPIHLRLVAHEELFDYDLNGGFEVEPRCPISKGSAEIWNGEEPISSYIKSKGFDCEAWLESKIGAGEANEYGARFTISGKGHIAMILPEEPKFPWDVWDSY